MSMRIISVILVLLLAACAQSSGILKIGPDTYTVSVHAAPARGGYSGSRGIALQDANEYCAFMNKEILVEDMNARKSSYFPGGTTEVIFKCIDPNADDYNRHQYNNRPNTVIEQRSR